MMTASEINIVLAALQDALREKIPSLKEGSVVSVEAVQHPGAYGSLVLSVLFSGGTDAKISLFLEWETASKLAGRILNLRKEEAFSEDQQLALEEVVKTAGERAATQLSLPGKKVESTLLPTLNETNALLSFHSEAEILKVAIQTDWDPILIYIAVPKAGEAQDAA